MDTRTGAYDRYRYAHGPAVEPVAVTRWTARLADPDVERNYRVERFPYDRRRAQFLMALAIFAGAMNFLVEIYAYSRGAVAPQAMIPPFVAIWLPFIALAVIRRMRTPVGIEATMVVCALSGVTTRMFFVSTHPTLTYLWPTLMVGALFVIYLYLPVRFTVAIALATVFSLVSPFWWAWALGDALPPDQFFRGLVWLVFADALSFFAANMLQRSQRIQYAQSLVLRELLSTDSMTGIGNRRRFDEVLDNEWRRCGRSGKPLSLLMIDVDHFKAYNDQCGHLQGDECLRKIARILIENVGRPGDLVARYGGEEFVCLLPEIGELGAQSVGAKFLKAVRQADMVHPALPPPGRVSISIGSATINDLVGREPGSLVALADKLLYEAKRAGRDQVAAGQID